MGEKKTIKFIAKKIKKKKSLKLVKNKQRFYGSFSLIKKFFLRVPGIIMDCKTTTTKRAN